MAGMDYHSSRVSDITNPKMYINPALGNTQSMLRRGGVVVVEHICDSAQAVASIFSHAIKYSTQVQ